jgi:hypothetical protein
MKNTFRKYSGLLQLRPEAIRGYLDNFHAEHGLKLLVVVGLIAGLGVLFGIPNALRQLTLPEQVDQAISTARSTTAQVVAFVVPVLTDAQSATETVTTAITEQVTAVTEQASSVIAGITAGVDAGREQVAVVQANPAVQQLLEQSTVTAEQIEAAVSEAPATAEQIGALLARANVTPQQAEIVLQRAGISGDQIAQAQQIQQQLQTQAGAAVESAMTQLQPLLAQLSMTEEQFTAILEQLATTPEQLNNILQQLSLAPEAVGGLIAQVEATPQQLEEFAANLRAEAIKAEPPLGTRASRVIHLFGEWLSVPLRIAGDWLLFMLVLLVITKLLGGRAPLPKHLGACALAAAPLVLLFGTYIPDMTGALSAPMAAAIYYYGRILAIIGLAWAALILLRTVSVAHEISLWRTAGALALTWLAIYVIAPLLTLFASGYLLAG